MRPNLMGPLRIPLLLTAILLGWCALPCRAHPTRVAEADAKLAPDGTVRLAVTFDVLAFALNDTPQRIADPPMNELLDGPAEVLQKSLADAQQRFVRHSALKADGHKCPLELRHFPTLADIQKWKDAGVNPRLPVMLELQAVGQLPATARSMTLQLPAVLGCVVLTIERPDLEPEADSLEEGEESTPLGVRVTAGAATASSTAPVFTTIPVPAPATSPAATTAPAGETSPVWVAAVWGMVLGVLLVLTSARRLLRRPDRPALATSRAAAGPFRVYLLAGAGIMVVTAVAEYAMGRVPLCTNGTIRFWVGATNGPETSQQLTDWYSFTHVLHGFILYGLFRLLGRGRWSLGLCLVLTILVESSWEVLENSPFIINRYRETMAQGYCGDSILNSMSDIVCCVLGFTLAAGLPAWTTATLLVVMEASLAWAIRDNLTLNILMLIHPFAGIRHWQMAL